MSEQTTTVQEQPVITQAIATARMQTELTRLNYQAALDSFNAWKITTDNTAETQAKIKKVRAFTNTIKEIKAKLKAPALAECDYWENAYKEILAPLQTSLTAKEKELQIILDKQAEENKKILLEKARVDGIKGAIDKFLLDTATSIAQCTTTQGIVALEKTIGSHKANDSRYQEFLPELIERANELIPIIKKQKGIIKDLELVEQKKNEAIAGKDDRALEALQDKEEALKHSLNETKINVQETSINQALKVDNTPQVQTTAVKYRRQSWEWEVKDIKELAKKAPHLVEIVPNVEAIDEWLKTKKADGSLKDKDEETVMGIRFYLKKLA